MMAGKAMAHGRNKYQSRENRARVREILMREWDPIGVAGSPEAADEYDSYVGKVYVMLMDDRAAKEQIAAYLYDVATNHMGLSSSGRMAERCRAASVAPVAARPDFETH
jgi:hypothetical protein